MNTVAHGHGDRRRARVRSSGRCSSDGATGSRCARRDARPPARLGGRRRGALRVHLRHRRHRRVPRGLLRVRASPPPPPPPSSSPAASAPRCSADRFAAALTRRDRAPGDHGRRRVGGRELPRAGGGLHARTPGSGSGPSPAAASSPGSSTRWASPGRCGQLARSLPRLRRGATLAAVGRAGRGGAGAGARGRRAEVHRGRRPLPRRGDRARGDRSSASRSSCRDTLVA